MTPFYDIHKTKTLVTRVRWIYCLFRRSVSLTQYLDSRVSDILRKYQYTLALLLWLINAVCVSINVFFREGVFAHLNFCKIKFLANKTRDLYADAHFSPSFSWRCIFRPPPPPYTSSFFAFVQTSGRGFNFPLSAFLLLQNSTPPSLLYSGAFLHNTCSGKGLQHRTTYYFRDQWARAVGVDSPTKAPPFLLVLVGALFLVCSRARMQLLLSFQSPLLSSVSFYLPLQNSRGIHNFPFLYCATPLRFILSSPSPLSCSTVPF